MPCKGECETAILRNVDLRVWPLVGVWEFGF